ncbi:hypothetical protein PIB30_029572 [Stylosanthes scabra]|uniref:Uncharacterized protein n=1 Tax=Stylosanthes scabra TaxID=79078 RepID=A0ABU6XBI0_9FABA|nr:hypothetical protein [Stylosanthes scabra]
MYNNQTMNYSIVLGITPLPPVGGATAALLSSSFSLTLPTFTFFHCLSPSNITAIAAYLLFIHASLPPLSRITAAFCLLHVLLSHSATSSLLRSDSHFYIWPSFFTCFTRRCRALPLCHC